MVTAMRDITPRRNCRGFGAERAGRHPSVPGGTPTGGGVRPIRGAGQGKSSAVRSMSPFSSKFFIDTISDIRSPCDSVLLITKRT